MKIKFWGVRGSVPTPGQDTIRYGGETSCIEITTDFDERIILDGGTGLRKLGDTLKHQKQVNSSILITHTHWDHIQGIPFFYPLYIPENNIDIYGSYDPIKMKSFKDVINVLMQFEYFPVSFAELKANLKYHDLSINQSFTIGKTKITTYHMNHPVLCLGYKIESNGKSIFYSGDNEPLFNIFDKTDKDYEEYEEFLIERKEALYSFLKDIDVLIFDSMYTQNEYSSKIGWGHGTYTLTNKIAKRINAKNVFFFHHDPYRTDNELDRIKNEIIDNQFSNNCQINYFLAKEGLEFIL